MKYSKSGKKEIVLTLVIIVLLVGSLFGYYAYKKSIPLQVSDIGQQIKTFSSLEEMKTFLEKTNTYRGYDYGGGILDVLSMPMTETVGSFKDSGVDFSTTNIQVAGVDEADIIKTDGKYIYVVSGGKVLIVDAYPVSDASVLSIIETNGFVQEMFVNGDKLVLFGYQYSDVEDTGPVPLSKVAAEMIVDYYPMRSSTGFAKVYDISDRSNPKIEKDVVVEGGYFNSRMIGDYVYVIFNTDAYARDRIMPMVLEDGRDIGLTATDVSYFDVPQSYYRFSTIISIDTQNLEKEIESKIFLMGGSDNLFVSESNIYVTYTDYKGRVIEQEDPIVDVIDSFVGVAKCGTGTKCLTIAPDYRLEEFTIIHKIGIDNGKITYQYQGEVPGHVLNQFSMDEYNGYFRIATTQGQVLRSGSGTSNNVYVLDDTMKVVGKLENLAQGEDIYSARFLGDRVYLVTFKKIDPLFVIDLKEPTNPKVLGQLKIPGYSDYLHPYDENHIIGVGKEAVEADEGNFAWYQGVKIALFDVSDPSKPKEVAKTEIGDRGTDSPILYDHKAFLFDKGKNLLVIPATVSEIDEEKYPNGVPANTYGDFVFDGAYVYSLTPENGFVEKGRVTHVEDPSVFDGTGYYYYGNTQIKRSLYIDDVLYTLSEKSLQMNDLNSLEEMNKIELSSEAYLDDVVY